MKINPAISTVVFVLILTGLGTPALAATKTASSTPLTHEDQTAVETRVREYFTDTPVMIEIARCESKFRQFTDSGNVLRGGVGSDMIGVFQFYEAIHAANAKTLGYNLETLDGNLAYARSVYQSQGTTPWNSSRYCWETSSLSGNVISSQQPTQAELKAKIKQLVQLIKLLKQLQELRARQV